MQLFLNCPRQYQYRKVWRWKPVKTSANLVFGRVLDTVLTEALTLHAKHLPVPSPAAAFETQWQTELDAGQIEYTNKAIGPQDLMRIGQSLAAEFIDKWDSSGMHLAILPDGQPALQVALEADLGDNLTYNGKLDLLAFNTEGELGVVDLKTAAASAMEGFDSLAPQLMDYQILCEANATALGIVPGDIRWTSFVELLKKKRNPSIEFRPAGQRRSDDAVEERLADIRAVARDIRASHFPRRAGMAFSTPCRMCEMKNHCLNGTMEGIVIDQRMQAPTIADLPVFDFDFEFDIDHAA